MAGSGLNVLIFERGKYAGAKNTFKVSNLGVVGAYKELVEPVIESLKTITR